MDRRTFLTGAASVALLAGGAGRAVARTAQAQPAAGAAGAANAADAQLATLMDGIFADVMRDNPEYATMLGLDTGPNAALRSQLGDYSPAAKPRALAQAQRRAAEMARIDRAALSERSRLHYDAVRVLGEDSLHTLSSYRYGNLGYSPYVISQQDGAYQSVPDFLDQHHRIANAADADAYLARLEAFAVAIDGNSEKQREDAGQGVFAPGFILETAKGQIEAVRNRPAAETVLVTSIARKAREANLPASYAERAQAIVSERVFPALDRQIALVNELLPRATSDAGVWRLPQGADYYASAVRSATTTTMTPQEVHQLGLDQVAEISGRINTILDRLGHPRGTIGERLTALNNDPAQLYPNTDEGRAALLADLNRQMADLAPRLPEMFATIPRADVRIVRVPEFIQDGAPNGYYNPAPLDLSRPALYYINLKDTHDWPKYGLASLTYHEAMPGHHLQISLAAENPDMPMLLKLSPFGAYVEGWALYAETLASEMGVYRDDPLGEVGMLQSLLFRAARLVVDTGLNHHRWSRERATDYMVETTGFPRPRTQREIDRYCASPGQACSYKVGHEVWERLRNHARTTLGQRFDVRQFHQILLKGALPLTILEQEVNAWIAAQQA